MGRSPIGEAFETIEQRSSHTFQIAHHVIIRDPKNMIAEPFQLVSAPRISTLIDMRVPIYFHDQRFARAQKINDGVADHGLATEFIASKLRTSENAP